MLGKAGIIALSRESGWRLSNTKRESESEKAMGFSSLVETVTFERAVSGKWIWQKPCYKS